MKFRTVALQPELISSLKQLNKELAYIAKPILDEQQVEYLNQNLCNSMEYNSDVTVTYYQNHDIKLLLGNIHHFDDIKNTISVVDKFDEFFVIELDNIIDIQT